MDQNQFIQTIILNGTWIYDGVAEKEVIILEQNYDYWYQIGFLDGDLEEEQTPKLNKSGKAYYYKFSPCLSNDPPWGVDSETFLSLETAKQEAENKINQKIKWNEISHGN